MNFKGGLCSYQLVTVIGQLRWPTLDSSLLFDTTPSIARSHLSLLSHTHTWKNLGHMHIMQYANIAGSTIQSHLRLHFLLKIFAQASNALLCLQRNVQSALKLIFGASTLSTKSKHKHRLSSQFIIISHFFLPFESIVSVHICTLCKHMSRLAFSNFENFSADARPHW